MKHWFGVPAKRTHSCYSPRVLGVAGDLKAQFEATSRVPFRRIVDLTFDAAC